MAEMWDIAKYVEEHPDDYEQRWRLAKKLYAAWEYRLALEHLQVLRNEWQKKLNVVRYLSATYYRLGRYDEAMEELREAIETWPQEIGLREQLARVLEIAGKRTESADVWKKIAELDPHHPIAKNAVKRLLENKEPTPREELQLGDSDSGIDLSPGRVCPNCGAQNSDEFDRCWQCHAQLGEAQATPRPTSPEREPRLPVLSPETLSMGLGIAVVAMLALCIYLSLKLMLPGKAGEAVFVNTLALLYQHELGMSRVITGVVVLVLWPFVLQLTLSLMRLEKASPPPLIWLAGLLQASLAFLCTWLPLHMVSLMFLLPAVVGLGAIVGLFGLGLLRALNVWILQLVLMGAVVLISFTACESIQLGQFFNPFSEIPAVLHYAQQQKVNPKPGSYPLPGTTVPVKQEVLWESTGSPWLDRRTGSLRFTVFSEAENAGLKFEINQGETKPLVFENVTSRQWTYEYEVRSGEKYFVKVAGPEGTRVEVTTEGLLIPKFLQ